MKLLRFLVITALFAGLFNYVPLVQAAPMDVVINEIAWMGSQDNSNDEWIELYNTTSTSIDLSGWYITDDGTTTYFIESGTIGPNGFFLIEDTEPTISTITADSVIGLSFANTGDALVLYNASDAEIDTVNSAGTMWAAGDNDTKASMERIDPGTSGDDSANWASNTAPSGDAGSAGSAIIGTPRTVNSVSTFTGTRVYMDGVDPQPGTNWSVDVAIEDASTLFSYGFDLSYDTTQLSLIGVDQKPFLSENATVNTTFHYGIDSLNNQLVVGEARTQNTKTTVDGSGVMLTLTFQVNGIDGDTGTLDFLGSSFLGGLNGDLPIVYKDLAYTIGTVPGGGDDQVQNLTVVEGIERYSLSLAWESPVSGADSYNIYRTTPDDAYVLIGTTTDLTYTDDDTSEYGGNIVPLAEYEYSVTAVLSAAESAGVLVSGQETRGLQGDNNRSDRVDGRDLESLALHFSETDSDANFDPLIDTSYDGYIDGDDLIHIGANWAENYVE